MLCNEQRLLIRMLLKVIADDYDVGSGIESIGHLLGRTYTSAYYQRHSYRLFDGTYQLPRHGLQRPAARLQIDELFAHELCCAGETYRFIGLT